MMAAPPLATLPNHTMPVCESANLAATRAPPLVYVLHPDVCALEESGVLSPLQIDTAARACQAITKPDGQGAFFIGDATGVGKTRTALAVALDRTLRNKTRTRVLWVSCKSALQKELLEELSTMERGVAACAPYGSESSEVMRRVQTKELRNPLSPQDVKNRKEDQDTRHLGGILFTTYGILARETRPASPNTSPNTSPDTSPNVSPNSTTNSTSFVFLRSVLAWLAEAPESLVVLDEVHVAKKKKSARHRAVCELQELATSTRFLYLTATSASDVANLGYMSRLGLWGDDAPFGSHLELCKQLNHGGLDALELVAMHLKSQGLYVARCLSVGAHLTGSMQGEPLCAYLSADEEALYNRSCALWHDLEARKGGRAAPTDERLSKMSWGALSSMKQAFFLRLITSFKARALCGEVRRAVAEGWAVVITLQSTGCGGDGFSSCKEIIRSCLSEQGEETGPQFPSDPLDVLMLELHNSPGIGHVCELTGRKRRLEVDPDGGTHLVQRSRTVKDVKLDLQRFQDGLSDVLIFSGAGATGISLHATTQARKRRMHFFLELPWSPEAFVQQCGRTHRVGELLPPLYRLVISDVPADKRICQVMSRRLCKLNALSKGDRHYSSTEDSGGTGMLWNVGRHRPVDPTPTTSSLHMVGLEVLLREAASVVSSDSMLHLLDPWGLPPATRRPAACDVEPNLMLLQIMSLKMTPEEGRAMERAMEDSQRFSSTQSSPSSCGAVSQVHMEAISRARAHLSIGKNWNQNMIKRQVSNELLKCLDKLEIAKAISKDIERHVEQQGQVQHDFLHQPDFDTQLEHAKGILRSLEINLCATYFATRVVLPTVPHHPEGRQLKWSQRLRHPPDEAVVFRRQELDWAKMVITVAGRRAAVSSLGRLGRDLLEQVLDFALKDDWNVPVSRVISSLQNARIFRRDLVVSTIENGFSPRFSATPLDVQRAMWAAFRRNELLMQEGWGGLMVDSGGVGGVGGVGGPCQARSRNALAYSGPKARAGHENLSGALIDSSLESLGSIVDHCYPHGIPPGCVAECTSFAWNGQDGSKPGHVLLSLELKPWPNKHTESAQAFHLALEAWWDGCHPHTNVAEQHQQVHTNGSLFLNKTCTALRVVTPARCGEVAVGWDIEVFSAGCIAPIHRLSFSEWEVWRDQNLSRVPSHMDRGVLRAIYNAELAKIHNRRLNRCRQSSRTLDVTLPSHALHEWKENLRNRRACKVIKAKYPFTPHTFIGVVSHTCVE